ncbi:TPA: hypothetical protein DIC20_05405 [Candidatus Dependentiae bacterium]|nr:MAG: hypothetical protein US03_C0005G0034 [candidate division TM6 bacterium GW2011_GWF2_36_131]KKQ03127.1 MAG: hypothetical protein US13_C0005G0011 [candidate division TM6 bacterium GW2011_GWE2_36_25]KKQ19385.1 MAG: hypothetical protein US32_C0010G0034 [candidate division TM6 bacterium GW2011_GWA2_36_9]HBR71028.1 hypothetical protein [Candidatus Dependentiae bacterium]HCU01102.1 hypothetical protein [Candidatus Dependentiae bacterium]
MKLSSVDAKRCIDLLSSIDMFTLEKKTRNKTILFEESEQEIRLRLRTHWQNNPKIVETFIKNNSDLHEDDIQLIKNWKDQKREHFFITKYGPEYTVFFSIKKDKTYAVLGLTECIYDVLPQKLPIFVEACLLPYKNCIIWDGLVYIYTFSFGKYITNCLINKCEKAEKENKIITSF